MVNLGKDICRYPALICSYEDSLFLKTGKSKLGTKFKSRGKLLINPSPTQVQGAPTWPSSSCECQGAPHTPDSPWECQLDPWDLGARLALCSWRGCLTSTRLADNQPGHLLLPSPGDSASVSDSIPPLRCSLLLQCIYLRENRRGILVFAFPVAYIFLCKWTLCAGKNTLLKLP